MAQEMFLPVDFQDDGVATSLTLAVLDFTAKRNGLSEADFDVVVTF